jgi:hypothetical protein
MLPTQSYIFDKVVLVSFDMVIGGGCIFWNDFCDPKQFYGYEEHVIYSFYDLTLSLILMINYLATYMKDIF